MLRALGFVRAQVQAIVFWEASVIVAIGLVLGIPLGVAAGRWMWTLAAKRTGALIEPVVAVVALAVMVPVALVLANLIAALPARVAGRLRPAEVLRAE